MVVPFLRAAGIVIGAVPTLKEQRACQVRFLVDAHLLNPLLQWVRNIRGQLLRPADACAQTDKVDKPCRGAAHRQSAHAKLRRHPRACADPYAGKEFDEMR